MGIIGWRYWQLGRDASQLEQVLADAQQETERLHSVIAEVQQFEQRRGQLQQRVGLIEQLRKAQTGPVHVLDQVSRAMPEMLWLTDLKQTPGSNEVVIDGRCAGLTSLSDFVANLEASGYFKRSIEIVSTQLDGSASALNASGDLIRFSIKAHFEPPAAGRAAAAPPAASSPAAGGTPVS
jgi:Tfp pilus assembly protein PilN